METKRFIELSLQAMDWNEKNLPFNTKEMQEKKVFEEFDELQVAADSPQALEELADVFIAISGLGRFSSSMYYAGLSGFFISLEGCPLDRGELISAIEKKLAALSLRKYEIVDGVYRHCSLN